MIGKTLYPLISFDLIYNKDIGVVRFIQKYIVHLDGFDLPKLRKMSDREILSLIHYRKNKNPLSVIPTTKQLDDSFFDNTYHLYMEKYKKQIVLCSPFTDFGYAVTMYISKQIDGIDPYILVSSSYEEDRIKSEPLLKDAHILYGDSIDIPAPVLLNPYYLNSAYDLLNVSKKFKDKFKGKTIYIANNECNKIAFSELSKSVLVQNNEYILLDVWRKDRFIKND